MPTYDDPAFGELTDPRVRLLIDLLSRDVHGELIAVALSSAGLDPGDYPLDRARLTWTAAVPDAARLGRLGALIEVVSATRPTFTRELESRLALLLRPPPAGGYSEDDPYRCSFVGLRGARAVIDRAGLRDGLRDLAEDQYWVLVVHGHPRSGKSHTWLLVDHLRNVGKLVGVNRFARVTTHRWSGEVTGEAVAMSLASELGLPVTLSPSGELDDARVRKFLDHLVGVYPGDDGVTRWIILDGLDRPGVQEGARDLARGLIQLVEDGELPQTRLIVTGLDPLGLHVGYAVRTEEIPAIDGTLLRAFLTDVAARLGRDIGDAELDAWITEILGPVPAARDLSEVEAAVVRLVRSNWTREAGPVGETPGTAAAGADRLVRAAVLSVFDLDWLEPGLADASGADRLANFLADSCERVVDVRGVPRWRLRDDERLRVLRSVPREVLLAAVDAAPRRPDEPVQHVLERYLRGTLPPPASLAPAELTGVLQLERWLGPRPGLPARRDVESRLDWLNLLAPLRRLLARGFVGREDVLAALTAHVDAPHPRPPFVIEGVAGSGKSAVLARLVETVVARGDLVCYAGFDRSWLVQGGGWSLLQEVARQIGMQLPADPPGQEPVTRLRRQVRRFVQRMGYSDVASRITQQLEPVPATLLSDLGRIVAGRRLVLVIDTVEELARRDPSLAVACSMFLKQLARAVPGLRVVAAGRARPRSGFTAGRVWTLPGLDDHDGVLLLRRLTGTDGDQELMLRVVRATAGDPLSLHLAADVLRRTGSDPARLIAIGEGDVRGRLYSRLLEHIKDRRARAIAHPGLVVRRVTPEVIRQVLAEPCGLAPLSGPDADEVFRALRDEATLCEPSTDGDGALVHRPNVRALMLGAITRDRPAAARAIHEAAVRFYRLAPPGPGDHVARREELYHRLMLKEPARELDPRWTPSVADELAAVMDEMPAESRLYLAAKVKGLRLDPEVRAEADDQRWRHSVRPSAESLLERGQSREALELLRERRGHDGRVLLPDLEIEALERLDRVDEALALAEAERRRASGLGHDARIRDLVTRQARILERTGRLERAWELLDGLARLDRSAARRRGAVLDDDVRPRELVVLTGLLRIARHSGRIDRGVVEELRAETVALAEATPARLLRRGPSLVRDLAAEIGDRSQWILRLATAVRGFDVDPGGLPPREPVAGDTVAYDGFVSEADKSQGYR